MSWLVVGVSGVTCGGKTTLASSLTSLLPDAVCVNQDKYFLPEGSPEHVYIPELDHNNWEVLTSMDMTGMKRDIDAILSSPPRTSCCVLLVEGHTVFNYPPVADLCRTKFYIYLDEAQCWERRAARTYDPPDVPGYFEKVVWPEHVRHRREMEERYKDVVMMDGMMSKEELLTMAMKEIVALIEDVKLR